MSAQEQRNSEKIAKLKRTVEKQQKEIEDLTSQVDRLFSRDQQLLIKVMQEAMSTYLETQVEFQMSVDGQIKEALQNE